MRSFLYGLALICGLFAFALFLHPIVSNLDNLGQDFGILLVLGAANTVAPIALALAVIPLCIALAFDLFERE